MVPRNRKRKDEKTERPREFDGISFSSSSTPSRWFLLLVLRLLLLPGLDFASCASCPFQSQTEYRKMCSLFSPLFFRLSSQKRKGEVRVFPDERNTRTAPCCARASSSSSLDAVGQRRRRRRRRVLEEHHLVSRFFASSPRRSGRRSSETSTRSSPTRETK